jgi:hypothetical protein
MSKVASNRVIRSIEKRFDKLYVLCNKGKERKGKKRTSPGVLLFLISYFLFLISYFLFLISYFLFLISYFLFLLGF